MPRPASDQWNIDEQICSKRDLKPPKAFLYQNRTTMSQRQQLRSRVPFQEYENVLKAK